MTSTTFQETVQCPKGHLFKIRRRITSVGFKTCTKCPLCGHQFEALVGDAPQRARAEASRGIATRESHVEDRLVKRVKECGGEVRKVSWQGRKGAPDRLVMLPEGRDQFRLKEDQHPPRTIWVELKAPGKGATFPSTAHERAQFREHERMRKMGQVVAVVDSYEQIEELLK